jgi:hypothetical protein
MFLRTSTNDESDLAEPGLNCNNEFRKRFEFGRPFPYELLRLFGNGIRNTIGAHDRDGDRMTGHDSGIMDRF